MTYINNSLIYIYITSKIGGWGISGSRIRKMKNRYIGALVLGVLALLTLAAADGISFSPSGLEVAEGSSSNTVTIEWNGGCSSYSDLELRLELSGPAVFKENGKKALTKTYDNADSSWVCNDWTGGQAIIKETTIIEPDNPLKQREDVTLTAVMSYGEKTGGSPGQSGPERYAFTVLGNIKDCSTCETSLQKCRQDLTVCKAKSETPTGGAVTADESGDSGILGRYDWLFAGIIGLILGAVLTARRLNAKGQGNGRIERYGGIQYDRN